MGLLEDIIDNKEKFKRRFKTLGENGFSVPSGGFIERIIQEKQELSREQAIGREASAIVASEPDSITDAPRVQESIVPRLGRIDDSGINGSGITIPKLVPTEPVRPEEEVAADDEDFPEFKFDKEYISPAERAIQAEEGEQRPDREEKVVPEPVSDKPDNAELKRLERELKVLQGKVAHFFQGEGRSFYNKYKEQIKEGSRSTRELAEKEAEINPAFKKVWETFLQDSDLLNRTAERIIQLREQKPTEDKDISEGKQEPEPKDRVSQQVLSPDEAGEDTTSLLDSIIAKKRQSAQQGLPSDLDKRTVKTQPSAPFYYEEEGPQEKREEPVRPRQKVLEEIKWFTEAVRTDPDDAEAHYGLGAAHAELGEYQEAVKEFKQATEIKPDHALAHYNLGKAYHDLNDKSSTLKQYKILETLNPELANKLSNLKGKKFGKYAVDISEKSQLPSVSEYEPPLSPDEYPESWGKTSISPVPGDETILGKPDLFRVKDVDTSNSKWGTRKGMGFLGNIGTEDRPISEFSVTAGLIVNGEDTLFPLVVSNSTKEELDILRNSTSPKDIPQYIIDKAFDHAKKRIEEGKDPFFNPDDDTLIGKAKKLLPDFGTYFPESRLPKHHPKYLEKTTFMKAMDILKPSLTLVTAPLTIPFNVILDQIDSIKDLVGIKKNKDSLKRINAIMRIIALNTQHGDEVYFADILKALGLTDKSVGLPEGTVERSGFMVDILVWSNFERVFTGRPWLKPLKGSTVEQRAKAFYMEKAIEEAKALRKNNAEIEGIEGAKKAAQGLRKLRDEWELRHTAGYPSKAIEQTREVNKANFVRAIINTADKDLEVNNVIRVLKEQLEIQDSEIADIVSRLYPDELTTLPDGGKIIIKESKTGVALATTPLRDKFNKLASKVFGSTKNPRDVSYILHDGKMLGKQGREHGEVGKITGIKGTTMFERIADFQLKTGAMRITGKPNFLGVSITAGQKVDNRTWGQLARIAKELQAPYIIIDVLDSSGRVIVGKEVSNYGLQGVGRARKIVEDVLKPPKKSRVEKLRNLALAAGSAGALALMGEDAEVEASPISNIIGKLGKIKYGRYGKNIPGPTGDTPLVEKVKYLAKKAMDPEVKKDQGIYNTGDVINILKKGVPEDELNHSGIKDFLINYEKEQVKLGKKKTIPIENILDYIQSNKMVSRGKVYGGVPKFTIPEGSAKRIDLINKKKKFDTEHDSIKVRRSHLDVKFGADNEKLNRLRDLSTRLRSSWYPHGQKEVDRVITKAKPLLKELGIKLESAAVFRQTLLKAPVYKGKVRIDSPRLTGYGLAPRWTEYTGEMGPAIQVKKSEDFVSRLEGADLGISYDFLSADQIIKRREIGKKEIKISLFKKKSEYAEETANYILAYHTGPGKHDYRLMDSGVIKKDLINRAVLSANRSRIEAKLKKQRTNLSDEYEKARDKLRSSMEAKRSQSTEIAKRLDEKESFEKIRQLGEHSTEGAYDLIEQLIQLPTSPKLIMVRESIDKLTQRKKDYESVVNLISGEIFRHGPDHRIVPMPTRYYVDWMRNKFKESLEDIIIFGPNKRVAPSSPLGSTEHQAKALKGAGMNHPVISELQVWRKMGLFGKLHPMVQAEKDLMKLGNTVSREILRFIAKNPNTWYSKMVNTVKQMKKEFHAKPLEEKVLVLPTLHKAQDKIPDILFAPEILIPGTEAASRFKSAARESLKFSKYRRGLEIPRGHIKGTRGPSIPKTGGYVLAIVEKEGTARFSHEEKFRSQLYRDYINYGGGMELMTHHGSSPRSSVGQTLGDVTNEVNPLSSRSDLLYDQFTGSLKGDFEHGTLGPIVSKLPGKYSSASKAEEALLRRKLSSENTRTKTKGIRFPIIDSRFNESMELSDIFGAIPSGAGEHYFTGLTEDIGKGLYRDLLASTTKDLPANIKSEYAAIKYLASKKMEGGKLGEITIDKKILELEELEKTLPMYEPSFERGGHYGKDNMGWYRGGSFDAAEKLLFLVDEFQSDQWATIRAKIRLLKKEQKKIIGDIKAGKTGSYTDIHGELHAFTKHARDFEGKLGKVIGDDIEYIQSKVAGLKNWRNTAIRYGMIEAVKRGADNYTWVGGSAIAERFSLGKVYDTIVWTKHLDDTYSLGGRPKSGRFNEVLRAHQGTQQLEASHLPPEELPLWVGEEVTDKITKGVGFNKAGFSEDIPIPLSETFDHLELVSLGEFLKLQPKDTRGVLNVKDLEVESRWAYGVYGDTKKVIEKKFPNEPSMLKYAWDGDNANMTATTLKTFLKRVLPDKAALTEAKASMGAYGVPQKDTGERFVVARQIDVDKVPEGQFADHMALVDKVDGVFHTQEEAYKFVKENRPYKITKDYADVPRTHTLSSPSKYTEETSVWRIFEVKRPYKEERVMPVEKEIYRDGVDIIDDALDNTVFRVREKDLQAVTEKINAPLQSPGPSQSFGSIPLNKKIIEAVKKGLSPIAMLPFMGWLLFGGDNEAEAGIISSGIKTAKDIAIKTAEKTAKTAREAARITAEKTKAVIPKAKLGEPSTKGEAFLKDVVRMQEKSEQQNRLTLDKAKRFLNTSIVDVKGHTKRALASYAKHSLDARLAIQRLDLIGGAHSKAIQDSSAAEAIIYGGLSKSKHILLDAFINAKRTIEIIKNKGKKFKVPPEFKKAQAFLDEMSPALKAELEPRAKAYWETFDALVAMMKAENLLSPEALAGLRKSGRNYSPRKVLEYFDPELTFTFGESKIIKVGTSGLKPLEKGTIKDIETNTSILLNEAIVRAHTRVFRNRANKSLYDFAKNVPHNGIVTLSKVVRVTKSGKQIFQKPLLGYDRIPVMIKGKRKEVLMRHEFAKGWVLRDPILNPAIANTLSWVSGSKILKAMATGLNPEFSLTNLPRDLAHILLITDEYSRTLPVAFIQLIQDITMIIPSATGIRPIRGGKSLVKTLKHKGVKGVFNKKDLQKVLKDTFNREGLYRDYINYGGGMEFMTHQGKFARSEFGRLTKVVPESVITQLGNVQTYLGYVGETSEIIGRLALMRRAMKNGATLEEATWIARTYLDFSQGGNIVKAMDSSVPYLNASIQGTRGIFRAARDKPGVFGYKAAQIGTASIMLYLANKYMNPEALKQIPPEVRAANWIITTPFSYLDKYGNRKYFYIKIAKDHGQRLIASLWENLFKRMWYKDEFDYKEVEDAVDAFAPRKPSDYLPPTFEAILGYAHNKDFWLKKEIWEGGKLSKPFEEYTSYTHPFFVELGQLSKDVLTERISLSPERTRIALSQVFTRGNPWTSLAGFAWKQIFKDLSQKEQDQVTAELIMSQPFLRRVLSGTDPVYEHGQMLKRVAEDSRTDIYAQNRDFDRLSQDFLDRKKKNARLSTRTDKAIQGFIKGLPKHVVKRLTARHKRRAKLQGITNIRMWLLLADIDVPENRARAFWNIWREGSKEEREQLIKDANKAPDIKSRRFIAYFNALKRQTLREEEPTLKRRQALQEEK